MTTERTLAYWKRKARDNESHRAAAEREVQSTTRWAHLAFEGERQLMERCTYLYGLAARYGATDAELHAGNGGPGVGE